MEKIFVPVRYINNANKNPAARLSIAPIFLIPDEALKTSAEKGFVSKEMYGDKWPLTVDSRTLSCVSAENLNDHLWAYETFITPAEKIYSLQSRSNGRII